MTPEALRAAFAGARGPAELARLRAAHQPELCRLATGYLEEVAPELSARARLSAGQKRGLVVLALACLPVLALAPRLLAIGLNAAFLVFTLGALAVRGLVLWLSVGSTRPAASGPPLPDEALPVVTVLCPVFREAQMLPGLVAALERLDYPSGKLDVKLLMEAEDHATIARAALLSPRFPLDRVVVPAGAPQTKPRACNHGLWSARGSLLVIYDAEDEPEPGQLRKAASAFAASPPEVVCLQARLNYRGWDRNWLTRMFAAEYALLFDLVLPGLDRLGAPLPLGGTSNVFRVDALVEAGGWDAYNVTEDADLGLRLAHHGWRARVLDSTTYEVPMARGRGWVRQRSRWIKGYLQCWAVHARVRPARDAWRHALTLHFVVGAVAVAALLNPVFWALYLAWLLAPSSETSWLFPAPLGPMATCALLLGNAFQGWLFMLAPLRRGWLGLVPFALTVPAYWAMQSVAGYKAVIQLVTAPFYWEKTEHEPAPPVTAAGAPGLIEGARA